MRFVVAICILALAALAAFIVNPAFAQPNIVLILVDDMSMDLMPDATLGTMPNLAAMQADGVTFNRHYVTESLCCPSRASIMTGMLPHNTGVQGNEPPNGGLDAWVANGLDAKSFAVALQAGGYKTAQMGKYLNGYQPTTTPIPPGWTKWVSTNQGYKAFGYTQNNNGVLNTPAAHYTDQIAALGQGWITLARQPFFMQMAPFSPHYPYTPAERHEGLYAGAVMPTTPEYDARPGAADPEWLQIIPSMKSALKANIQNNYVLRLQAMASIDDMIGDIRDKVAALGIAGNTYIIFTSDNGYHMGQRSLRPGKQGPFDTDTHVPMVIVGPGIAAGTMSERITSHADLFPTFLEWAGLPPNAAHDGRSMFTGTPRTLAVIEHVGTLLSPDDPDYAEPKAGNPPDYTALRGDGWMYVEYETGEVGYYVDQYQLANTEATMPAAQRTRLHDAVAAVAACAGVTCQAAQER